MSEQKDAPQSQISIYKKLNGKLPALILGMILVGTFNVLPLVISKHHEIFPAADSSNRSYNLLMLALAAIVLGVLDVLVFCTPLYDIFKIMKKEGPMEYTGELRVKLCKVYVIAHLPVLPMQTVLLYVLSISDIERMSTGGYLFALLLSFILSMWFYILISRGVNALYNFQPLQRTFVFPIALVWSFILGTVLEYGLNNFVIKLFRV